MLSMVQERIQYLQELGEFMSSARKSVKDAAERLGWTNNQVSTPRTMVTCPLNPGHRVKEDRFQDHLQACKWRSEGYLEEATPLPESCADGTRPTKSITIDSEHAEKIIREAAAQNPTMKTGALGTGYRPIPQTSDRLISDFTTDERRAIYDYVVSQTGVEPVKLEDLQLPFKCEKKSAPKSKLELLAEERDAKRRRISYRSKKVSTNRKSHTEVMREVIQNQMHLYETWLKKDEELNEEENESEDFQQPTVTGIKQECQDDGYEKYEQESGNKRYNYTPNTNSEMDERQSRRDSSTGSSRNNYASSSRDKYNQDRVKYTDRNQHRSRPRESGQNHSREYNRDYRNESRDRHNRRRGEQERGYRDKESRSTRDKYHERDKDRRRSRDSRENSLSKGDRSSKYRNPEGKDDSSNTDIVHRSVAARGKRDFEEQKYSHTREFAIFQDMQRLLDAQVAADAQRERPSFSRSLSNGNEDNVAATSVICKSEDLSDDSDEGTIRHKSRSHKHKKRKKGKHKKKKHSKKSKKKVDSSSSNDSSSSSGFSC